jgi:branched-subunit amino acid transport protein
MAIVTYITRISFLTIFRRLKLPDPINRSLKYIPVGILTAIIISGIFAKDGKMNLSINNSYLAAGVLSGLVAYRWKNVLMAMFAGILTVILFQLI